MIVDPGMLVSQKKMDANLLSLLDVYPAIRVGIAWKEYDSSDLKLIKEAGNMQADNHWHVKI